MSGLSQLRPASGPADAHQATVDRLLAPTDLALAAAVTLLAGAIYWLGSAPGVLFGDGGELQFAAWNAGLPHPTGYPLYMLLGWAWTHLLDSLGLASPARAMNLLSVLFAALAVGLTYLVAHAMIELSLPKAPVPVQRISGLLAATTFAFTPTFWSQALITEVYSLHAVLVALLLGLALRWRKDLQRERAAGPAEPLTFRSTPTPALMVMALVLGLSLTHHRTAILLVPVLVIYVWRQDGYRLRHPRWLIVLGALATIPLLLYLFVPLRVDASSYLLVEWAPGQVLDLINRSPRGLVGYALGRSFAGELQGLTSAIDDLPGLLPRFTQELGIIGIGLGVLGVVHLTLNRQKRLLWLTGASFLLLTAFNLFYTIGDIRVFYIAPYLILCCWIGLGAAFVAQEVYLWVRQMSTEGSRMPEIAAALLLLVPLLVLPLTQLVAHADRLDRSGHSRPERWWRQLLATNPPTDAILISNDRDEIMPLWYLQHVEGLRMDLTGVFPGLLPGPAWANIGRVLDRALETGRPVYLIKPMPGLDVKVELGLNDSSGLTPVLGPALAGTPQREQDSILGGQVRLVGYDVSPVHAGPGDTVQVTLYWQPLQRLPVDYTSFVHLRQRDNSKLAQSDKLLGDIYYPTSHWEPGEILADHHIIQVPQDAPTGPYELYAGLYQLVGSEAQTMDAVVLAGSVGGNPPLSKDLVAVANPTYANFNDEVLLIGYDLSGGSLVSVDGNRVPEQQGMEPHQLRLKLLWQAARPMSRDYTVFVHLLDPGGSIVSQVDAQPFDGAYPTSVWEQGELLADTYHVPLPSTLRPGIYRVVVGLYLAGTQQRLPAYDDVGQRFPNDRVPLADAEFSRR